MFIAIMPKFISDEFMEDRDDGTDLRFDFHQLADHDYSKSEPLKIWNWTKQSFSENQFAPLITKKT